MNQSPHNSHDFEAMPDDTSADPRQLSEAFFDELADDYQRWEQVEWPRLRWLRKVLQRLEPGSSVLDLGCGSGDPADIEIARQHRVTGVDHSIAQIERARRNVPAGHFIHGDLAAPELPRSSFDAVVSFYALEGIPRAEHAAVLRHAHDLSRPGGYLLLGTEPMDREAATGVYRGMRMVISGHDADTLLALVRDAGFRVLESQIETQIERGHDVPYLWVLAQRD